MKKIADLERDILKITMKINEEFPELADHLIETPIKFSESNSDNINRNNLEDYYDSLNELLGSYSNEHLKMDNKKLSELKQKQVKILENPENYSSNDVYENWKEKTEIDPENINKKKVPNEETGKWNEKDFEEDMSGDDLDIPGAELDDEQENVGSEDEENNHYSLGGDNHHDLEEDKA